MATQVVGISLMILGARLDDIGLWRKTGRAALYVMTAMALVSGFDYFRRYLKELLLIASGAPCQPPSPGATRRKTALKTGRPEAANFSS